MSLNFQNKVIIGFLLIKNFQLSLNDLYSQKKQFLENQQTLIFLAINEFFLIVILFERFKIEYLKEVQVQSISQNKSKLQTKTSLNYLNQQTKFQTYKAHYCIQKIGQNQKKQITIQKKEEKERKKKGTFRSVNNYKKFVKLQQLKKIIQKAALKQANKIRNQILNKVEMQQNSVQRGKQQQFFSKQQFRKSEQKCQQDQLLDLYGYFENGNKNKQSGQNINYFDKNSQNKQVSQESCKANKSYQQDYQNDHKQRYQCGYQQDYQQGYRQDQNLYEGCQYQHQHYQMNDIKIDNYEDNQYPHLQFQDNQYNHSNHKQCPNSLSNQALFFKEKGTFTQSQPNLCSIQPNGGSIMPRQLMMENESKGNNFEAFSQSNRFEKNPFELRQFGNKPRRIRQFDFNQNSTTTTTYHASKNRNLNALVSASKPRKIYKKEASQNQQSSISTRNKFIKQKFKSNQQIQPFFANPFRQSPAQAMDIKILQKLCKSKHQQILKTLDQLYKKISILGQKRFFKDKQNQKQLNQIFASTGITYIQMNLGLKSSNKLGKAKSIRQFKALYHYLNIQNDQICQNSPIKQNNSLQSINKIQNSYIYQFKLLLGFNKNQQNSGLPYKNSLFGFGFQKLQNK